MARSKACETLNLFELTDLRLMRIIQYLERKYGIPMETTYLSFQDLYDHEMQQRAKKGPVFGGLDMKDIHLYFIDLIYLWLSRAFFDFDEISDPTKNSQTSYHTDERALTCTVWVEQVIKDNTQ